MTSEQKFLWVLRSENENCHYTYTRFGARLKADAETGTQTRQWRRSAASCVRAGLKI